MRHRHRLRLGGEQQTEAGGTSSGPNGLEKNTIQRGMVLTLLLGMYGGR